MKIVKVNLDELNIIIINWENRARNLFDTAKHTDDPMGKRLVEHGAMCYFNCSSELRKALSMPRPELSPIEGEDQK